MLYDSSFIGVSCGTTYAVVMLLVYIHSSQKEHGSHTCEASAACKCCQPSTQPNYLGAINTCYRKEKQRKDYTLWHRFNEKADTKLNKSHVLLQGSLLRSMRLCFLRQSTACTTTASRRRTAMALTTMQWMRPHLSTLRAQAPIGWGGWSSLMVILLHTTMFVRQNLVLATQGAQAAIREEGGNSPMDIINMQVLLLDLMLLVLLLDCFCS